MSRFDREDLNHEHARLEALDDKALLAEWKCVGQRLFDVIPETFMRVFHGCLRALPDEFKQLRTTVEDWHFVGFILVHGSPHNREVIAATIVSSLATLAEVEATTS